MKRLDGRVAVITGGARGQGASEGALFASEGATVYLTDVLDDDGAKTAADVGATFLHHDVTDPAQWQAVVDRVVADHDRLDVLVNNAGVAPTVRADVLDATEESFDRVLGINLKGPYFLTQLAARWMIEQREADASFAGAIVNISSISATEASINRGDYCISKAGLAMATQLWAHRLAEHGIAVYEIRPGLIRTDMSAPVAEKYDRLIAGGLIIENRWGNPDEVGRAVAMLARGELTYATGNVLNIDGGLTLRRL
jgi:3-oxoacyl-[acyl-carrier protein] reductase